MKIIILLTIFCCQLAVAQSELCSQKGAYGIAFGSKPSFGSKKISETDAVTKYQVKPKQPDARFDEYWVTTERKTGKIYKIIAVRYMKPIPTLKTGDLPKEQRAQNIESGRRYIMDTIHQFKNITPEQFIENDDSWAARIDQEIKLKLNIENYWTLTFECLDINRENSMVKKYWTNS